MATAVILCVFASCKKEVAAVKSPAINTIAQTQTDSNFVSFNLAATAARQVTSSHLVSNIIKLKAVNDLNSTGNRAILDTLAVPNKLNPSYYIFNFVGGGYVIIAADKRVEPILAYGDDGYFPHSGTLPGGLVNWLETNHTNMQLLRKNTKLKIPAAEVKLWAELLAIKTGGGKAVDNLDNGPHPPCQPTYTSTTVGPFLTTNWGQWYPYNYLCPVSQTSYSPDGFKPTGCVATAMAQVMYYWKAPVQYNYNIMPLTANGYGASDPGNHEVSLLMTGAGASVGMSYDEQESSADDAKCAAAFKSWFSYASASHGNYDYQTVTNNLDQREPVLLGAYADAVTVLGVNTGFYKNGHSWVCDGYNRLATMTCPTYNPYTGDVVTPAVGSTYLYLHMNWGWDNSNNVNGYFAYNQWIVTSGNSTYNFQYSQTMTYNIHP